MDAILELLVASPALPWHVATLERLLVDERARRERFYEEMTEEQKVEFINGEVFMHSPVKVRHSDAMGNLFILLKFHVARHDLGWVSCEKSLVCLTRNDYEPDIVFYGPEKAARLQPDQMKLPAPDFVVEVLSPNTERHDRGVKFEDYAAHGVGEYWLVDPVAATVEQYALAGEPGAYQLLGICAGKEDLASAAVPGFRIPAEALFNRQANLAAFGALGV